MTSAEISSTVPYSAFIAVIVLAVWHLIAGRFGIVDALPRRGWLSFAAGVSVAYVFGHILPELDKLQETFTEAAHQGEVPKFIPHHVYFWALGGLMVFYGLKSAALRRSPDIKGEQGTSSGIFWLYIAVFSLYNMVIGYMIVMELRIEGLIALFIGCFALGMHFLVIDHHLRREYQRDYDRIVRWLFSAGILIGCGVGAAFPLSELAFARIFAFVGGGIIMITLNEEVPSEHQGRFWAFVLGIIVFTALLLLLYNM
jgi:hypothetical protein